jgi:hypothetical protein
MQVMNVNSGTAAAANSPERPAQLPVGAFLSGRADELVVDLLAYALYARERETRGAEGRSEAQEDVVIRCRREAGAELTTFAYRFFHNQVEEIRIAAVRDHLGSLPRPPGFLRLVLASAFGIALVGAGALWAMGQGGLLAEMAARAAAAARDFGL